MSSTLSFSGIASGLQWQDMIDQIMQLERAPARLLEQRIKTVETRSGAWSAFEARVAALGSTLESLRTGSAFHAYRTSLGGVPAGVAAPLTVSASEDALPGSHTVRVLGLAAAEKLSGAVVASRTEALGLSGEFLVGGVRVEVSGTDSLNDIVARINRANTGSRASGVTASILSTGPGEHRLILTSDRSGAAGIDLVDGASGVLRSLGLLDDTTSLKHGTSNGARSDAFSDASTAVATLRGLSQPPAVGAVEFGAGAARFSVAIDLSTMSLDDIAAAINSAAADAGSGVHAAVVTEEVDGEALYRLDIRGTTSFVDANRILESLGVLEGGRGAIAQRLEGGRLTAGDASTAAGADTRLADLWVNGGHAGVQVGDTITISGTRGEGTRVEIDFTVEADSTLQDLLDRLNDSIDGFGAGARTATASISTDGRLVLTDDQGGDSRLSLSIVAHNEGGGTLDFGEMAVVQAGRARQITRGADAEVEIDGTYVRSSTNTIADALPGLSLNLTAALPDTTLTVTVERDVAGAVAAVKSVVDAYNAIADFIQSQTPSGIEGAARPPLAGDNVLRNMQTMIRQALETRLAPDVAGAYARLADIGVEIDRNGRYTLDAAALEAALRTDADAVARLFGVQASASGPGIQYVTHRSETASGTYAIEITRAAARGAVTGVGFGGTYIDDGTPDTMVVRDRATGKAYAIELSNGMSLGDIVAALNAEFSTATRHVLAAAAPLYRAADGSTVADEATSLAELYHGDGTNASIADGTVFTFSGRRANGSTFLSTFVVEDASTQTLGDLARAIQAELGDDAVVRIEDGVLTVTAAEEGASRLELAVSTDVPGNPSPFGSLDVRVEGRGTARIIASVEGGQLRIAHEEYGSAEGFDIEFIAGGADGTASLGIPAGSYAGQDVEGTIGGHAATGTGQILTGAAGSPVDGFVLRYDGTDTGAVGEIAFSQGIAGELDRVVQRLTGRGDGSIGAIVDRLGSTVRAMNDRIDRLEDRLEQRRENLIRRFMAMEQALAQAMAQSQWLMAQLGSLNGGR